MTLPDDVELAKTRPVSATEVDDELVMMDVERGRYYGMNAVAGTIWKLLDEPITPAELRERLLERFDIDEATCRTEVDGFLAQLAEAGLIAPLA